MTYATETKIIAHVCDVDLIQVGKIGEFLHAMHLQFGYDYDRDSNNGTRLYTITADVTGHSAEFYLYLDAMNK